MVENYCILGINVDLTAGQHAQWLSTRSTLVLTLSSFPIPQASKIDQHTGPATLAACTQTLIWNDEFLYFLCQVNFQPNLKTKLKFYNLYIVQYSPIQQAMCTMGPSLPRLRPADTASIMPTDFMISVHFPKYPRMIKPLSIVLI